MPLDLKPGRTVRVKISKAINRVSARKTLERLFMEDRAVAGPLEKRSRNFIPLPKRRGGQIWTKRPNKIHPNLVLGFEANVRTTAQSIKDLNSVADFIKVK